jgi:putative PIN family toxin of toxin-antitoxin system
MIPVSAPSLVPRIVLDTNVCLDLFVFHDPRWQPLLRALDRGEVVAVTRADCRDEYRFVLHYPHLPLDEAGRALAAERFDNLIALLAVDSRPIRLPVCSDRDDQKFLELARDSRAEVLVTKDKALLKLGRKTVKEGLFKIMLPEAWVKERSAHQTAALDPNDPSTTPSTVFAP